MKTATIYANTTTQRTGLPYPNAATRRQVIHRILDLLLMGAIGMAFAAIFLFLTTMA